MKLKRQEALIAYNGLQLLERGKADGKPFDLDWATLEKILHMSLALKPVQETYQKARQQRVLTLANGSETIEDPKKIRQLNDEEEKILQETISVKLPKELLDEGNLKCKDNKIPPSVLIQLGPLFKHAERSEIYDEDSNDY